MIFRTFDTSCQFAIQGAYLQGLRQIAPPLLILLFNCSWKFSLDVSKILYQSFFHFNCYLLVWTSLAWFCWGAFCAFWIGIFVSFPTHGKFSAIIPSNTFSIHFSFPSPYTIPIMQRLLWLMVLLSSLNLVLFFFSFLLFRFIPFYYSVLQVPDLFFWFF